MSLDALMVDSVAIVHPTWTTGRYGDRTPNWTTTTTTTTKGRLTRRSAQEVLEGRDAIVTGWLLYLPVDATIAATDRVVVDGVTYEVDGPALIARTIRDDHHLEVQLRAVVG